MSDFKVVDDFQEQWSDIEKYVGSLQDKITDEKKLKECLREIGKYIARFVKQFAPPRTDHPSYSDAGKANYKHIVDDVKVSVKKNKFTKQSYVSVHGGKWTGYKWLWVNDGHVMKDGTLVAGNHFLDKAEKASEDGINDIVDKYIEEVFKYG